MLPFIYMLTLAVGVNGQATGVITIEQDSFFELHHIHGNSSLDAPTDFHPNNFSLAIKDNSTSRFLQSAAVDQSLAFGPSTPLRQFRPVRFAPNTTLEFTANDLVASAQTVKVALIGYKVFAK